MPNTAHISQDAPCAPRRSPWRVGWICLALLAPALLTIGGNLRADDLDDATALYHSGKYAACIAAAEKAIADITWIENWRHLKIRAEMRIGRYDDALKSLEEALGRHQSSIRLRFIGHDVYQFNGRPEMAQAMYDQIEAMAGRAPWRYTDGASRVVLGRFLLKKNSDARQVLELIYDEVKKDQPQFVDTYIASGDLALEKSDFGVAVDEFNRALKLRPTDSDIHFKLAVAYSESDTEQANAALGKALELNPRHPGALLFQADHLIDSEQYDEAKRMLDEVLAIHPTHPRAWAYLAVMAHLKNDQDEELCRRYTALSHWPTNPEVDHLIGRELSQKYRFAEGAKYQRQALEFDPSYAPAKIQLSQDLLRLGRETEGWRLADDVYESDNYNVTAYNLVTLHDNLRKFRTLQDEHFIVRMARAEAEIYGPRVLSLLHRAKKQLCEKYEMEIDEPVVVEIFDQQKDFAIRTFGMPGGAGFLGVCFGKVITANSPASQGDSPANWESVLWHEFCHVVTLQKTNNKMPRWLSEGISVYEELQEDSSWGQSMIPTYREMILGGELTPVSQLSGAFLQPPSPLHLQFAYFESALVVQYLVDQYGLDTLRRVLVDLGVGMPINDALQRYVGSLDVLDKEFAEFARTQAEMLAPQLDWEKPRLPDNPDDDFVAKWNEKHPDNFWGLQLLAREHIEAEQWREARKPLERLIALYPGYVEAGNSYQLLASVYRSMEDVERERETLEQLAQRTSDDVDTYLRLIELAVEAEDWEAVAINADRLLAVNPLIRDSHRAMAEAAHRLGRVDEAIQAYRSLLALQPVDLAGTRFQLARLLMEKNELELARRQVLMALEEAPRYREAHRLLLALHDKMAADDPAAEKDTPSSKGQP